MSIKTLDWAFDIQIDNPGAKLVLLALANYDNSEGGSFPTIGKIEKLTSIKPRTIATHLNFLEDQGIIKRHERFLANGGKASNLYEFCRGVLPIQQESTAESAGLSYPPDYPEDSELRSGAEAPIAKILEAAPKKKTEGKQRSEDPVWGEFLYHLVDHHGADEVTTRKVLGKLTGSRGYGIDFVQAIYAENRKLILDAEEPMGYLMKLLQIQKDTTPEDREADQQLREARRYHVALHQNLEYIPDFNPAQYLGRFPLLKKFISTETIKNDGGGHSETQLGGQGKE